MKDLGIQSRTIELARDLAKRLPGKPLGALAGDLVARFDLHGGFDPSVATAVDELYLVLRALDTDDDGMLSPAEVGPYADLANELMHAIQCNDRDGDVTAADVVPLPIAPVSHKPGDAEDTPHVAFGDLGRRAIVLTLWSGRGARYAWEQSRPLIELARPDGLMAHTDPVALTRDGTALVTDIRAAHPYSRVLEAIYGDSYGPDPSQIWARWARHAQSVNAESGMVDAEGSHKRLFRGSTLEERNAVDRRAVNAARAAAPRLHLSHTSYDGPVSILRPDGKGRWGGHETYPWKGFLGAKSPIQASGWQRYVAGGKDEATYGMACNRLDRSLKSVRAAVKKGIVSADVEDWTYAQVHHSSPAAICRLSEQSRVTCLWASPSRIDARGILGIRAACELARRNQTVKQFQQSAGLAVDGIAGAKTLEALGVA